MDLKAVEREKTVKVRPAKFEKKEKTFCLKECQRDKIKGKVRKEKAVGSRQLTVT